MKTIVFPKFPEKLTGKSLNILIGEMASFSSAENINAIDYDKIDDFREAFRAFNTHMHDLIVVVGREIVSQMPERDYAKDYALVTKLLEGEKKGTLNRAGKVRLKLLKKRLNDASTGLLFVRYMTERHIWYAEQVEHALSHKYINEEALFKLLPAQLEDMRVMMSTLSGDGEDRLKEASVVAAALEKKDAKTLLAHAHSFLDDLKQIARKLSGQFPNLNNLVSAANALLPKTFTDKAEADTGALIKTFLTWFAVASVGYWLYYFLATELAKAKIRFLWDPVRKVIYPPVAFEDLTNNEINNMLIIMLLLAVGIAGLAIFLKALKSRGKKPHAA